jgi:hypothetical protein
MIKPGYRTSEFWFTLVSFLFSGLYLLGLIGDNSQKEDLIRDVSHGVESIILIGGQLAILWKYINSRKEIKKTWWNTANEEERKRVDEKNDVPIIKTKKKRSKPNGSTTVRKRSNKSSQ